MLKTIRQLLKPKGRNSKPSDATATYEHDVEWFPRPSILHWYHVDEVREWMMRETLDSRTESFDYIRDLHKKWGGVPTIPHLGESEPKFPKGVYKQAHGARMKFASRWQKANHPGIWSRPGGWLVPYAPWHFPSNRSHASHFYASKGIEYPK